MKKNAAPTKLNVSEAPPAKSLTEGKGGKMGPTGKKDKSSLPPPVMSQT